MRLQFGTVIHLRADFSQMLGEGEFDFFVKTGFISEGHEAMQRLKLYCVGPCMLCILCIRRVSVTSHKQELQANTNPERQA